MVIDFDTSRLPTGPLGWAVFLDAIDAAQAGDENEWVEFKANLDPATADGRAAVAKAVVAFANRDPNVATKWLTGHAVIVIGLEPGNLVGAPDIDPADLYNKVNALLASPAPRWEPVYVAYREKQVLLVVVDPPKPGDPIAVIGKSSGVVEDGNVYVRVIGKSDCAKAADLRRLSGRLAPAAKSLDGISVAATGTVAIINASKNWVNHWTSREESRLLSPLAPPPATRTNPYGIALDTLGINGTLSAALSLQDTAPFAMAAIGMVKHAEDREEDAFRSEVDAYLDDCRRGLARGFEALKSTVAAEVTFTVTNHTDDNYEQVLVELHIEGDVCGYGWDAGFKGMWRHLPQPPRPWGPWEENPLADARYGASDLSRMVGVHRVTAPAPAAAPPRPRPTIVNGGSVNVTAVPLHLRPGSTENLITLRLVGEHLTGPVNVTWTATATNMPGTADGTLTIPVASQPVDLDDALDYEPPRRKHR